MQEVKNKPNLKNIGGFIGILKDMSQLYKDTKLKNALFFEENCRIEKTASRLTSIYNSTIYSKTKVLESHTVLDLVHVDVRPIFHHKQGESTNTTREEQDACNVQALCTKRAVERHDTNSWSNGMPQGAREAPQTPTMHLHTPQKDRKNTRRSN